MSNVPNIPSNKKCWQNLNKLVFGDSVSCPGCSNVLQENYPLRYLWCRSCRRKYRPTSYHGSWLYGMKISPRQLLLLLWCWQRKKSTEAAVLKVELSYPTVARWFDRFRKHLPDTMPLLEGLVQADESYFSKLRSKQAKYIVTGATEPDTGKKRFVSQATIPPAGRRRCLNGLSKTPSSRGASSSLTSGMLMVICHYLVTDTKVITIPKATMPIPMARNGSGA